MGKEAIDIDQQICLLKERGMLINNEDKAKEVLLDVGYYRLGFYWFPFEISYPCKTRRIHKFREGTNFEAYMTKRDLKSLVLPLFTIVLGKNFSMTKNLLSLRLSSHH